MVDLIRSEKVITAVVGSYPKPPELFPLNSQELIEKMGLPFYEFKESIGEEEFQRRADLACLRAIQDQNDAEINIQSDGEERRGHYIMHILRGLGGFDTENLKEKEIRAGRYRRKVPVVREEISHIRPILLEEFLFLKKHSRGIPKIALPGPFTVVDSVVDEFYHDQFSLAMGYARAIKEEVKTLIEAGCRAIQFDEPVFLRYPEEARLWGVKALYEAFSGLENEATFFVHICRGYPDKYLQAKGINYKAENYYRNVFEIISEIPVDVISVEGSEGDIDISSLQLLKDKTLMLGVIDVGREQIESVSTIVDYARSVVEHIGSERLIIAPDCGMIQLSLQSARAKLFVLKEAAERLNNL